MTCWHEDDRFWETVGPGLFHEGRWRAASQEVDALLRLVPAAAGARVLDLCCGPGRHSLELARRGFRVTGVDRTSAFLAEARRRADAEGLSLELVQDDMRRFKRPGAFDLVINMYTSFGYFEDPEEDLQVLRNVWESLRQGGRVVLDLMGKEVLARVFVERSWVPLADGSLFLEERRVTRDWSWIEHRWIVVKEGALHEFRFGHRLYSAAELRELLLQAGFSSVQIFGSLDGAPYDHQARRLVAVATKG